MTEPTELKLCKDCKHFCRHYPETDKCKKVKSDDMVYGEFISCITARWIGIGECKPEGVLFEPKLSMWYKLKNIFRKPSRTS